VAEVLVRAFAEIGPAAIWLGGAALGLIAVCLLYLGIALWATLRTDHTDPGQWEHHYQVFHELVGLIRDLFRCRGAE
jgi:hypothetical protein